MIIECQAHFPFISHTSYIPEEASVIIIIIHTQERSTDDMYTIKSITRLEYPHSLSYQDTTLTKLSLREMPAFASKILDRGSWTKSCETTASSVYPRMPFMLDSEAVFIAAFTWE
mmetsp:Transcript_9734/g.13410  ORF Transcript_9734/g.13410 Transcript_9734/m.13410 type:complete len:115 (-) Transcript_9734:789-1133(-)